MHMKIASVVAVIAALLFGAQAHAAGDAAAGKTAFANQCASCHTVEAGKNGFGPLIDRLCAASVSPPPACQAHRQDRATALVGVRAF